MSAPRDPGRSHAGFTVLLSRVLWSRPSDRRFREIHSPPTQAFQIDHRQTPQRALDRSRSFLASQDFGIPAVFIPRQVLTVRSRTPLGAQVSHGVSLFQPGVPGAIVSGSFVRDPVFSTRSSRRPGQDILRECSMGPVQPGFQARRVPRWPVLITSGPEDQESGQSVSLNNGALDR